MNDPANSRPKPTAERGEADNYFDKAPYPELHNRYELESQQNRSSYHSSSHNSSNNVAPNNMMTENQQRSLVTYNHITYLLYVVSYFTAGLLWVVPIVMNYAKRHDANNTWLATHFDWQIKTFWYSIVSFVIAIIIIMFALGGMGVSVIADSGGGAMGSFLLAGLGLLIIVFTVIWHIYRIIRGWIALTDNRPVP